MIPQIIKYFRFEPFTDSDGTTYMAPVDFKGGDDYYRGYDLAPFAVKYVIHRDIDLQPDTFTIIIDNYFFQNPNNVYIYHQLSTNKLTDPVESFQPTSNHIIAIGPVPDDADDWNNYAIDTYCYEDHQENLMDGPVFGFIKSWTQVGTDKTEIICVSLLKVVNEVQLDASYILNQYQDDVNKLQVYYEYKSNEDISSSPYFASFDPANKDKYGSVRILPANPPEDKNDYPPRYPRRIFTGTAVVSGYPATQIVWRLLQEIGWCRQDYQTSAAQLGAMVKSENSQNVGIQFINSFQTFYCNNEADFDFLIMGTQITDTKDRFKFKSFDCDGFRFEYPAQATGTELTFTENYFLSFDPSKQTILYNLKTICDATGIYMTVTVCPRFVKRLTTNDTEFVWDYSIYGPNRLENLKRWGVSAGFKPKVMMRRNYSQIFSFDELTTGTQPAIDLVNKYLGNMGYLIGTSLSYGSFTKDVSSNDKNQVLVKGMKWEQDQADVINKLLIKYGQGQDYAKNYLEFPLPVELNSVFMIDLSGIVENSTAEVRISVSYKNGAGTIVIKSIQRNYSIGATSFDIVKDIINNFSSVEYLPFFIVEYTGDTLMMIPITDINKAYWNTNREAISIGITYQGSPGTKLGYTKDFLEIEPIGFETARNSQKLRGIKATRISLPEVVDLLDVIKVSDMIFRKLANPKYRCITDCANSDTWQLPIFGLYNILDNTHTKRVINDEGASIQYFIGGSPIANGNINIAVPTPRSYRLVGFSTYTEAGATIPEILNAIKYEFDTNVGTGPDIIATIDVENNYIKFTYDPTIKAVDFKNKSAFNKATICAGMNGLSFKRIVNPPAQFKEVAFNEYLPLLSYDSDSTKATYSCTFGVPNEELSNIISQSISWISDVEKGT